MRILFASGSFVMKHCRSSLLPGNIHGMSAGGIVKPGGGNIGTGVGFWARALGEDRSKAPLIAAQTRWRHVPLFMAQEAPSTRPMVPSLFWQTLGPLVHCAHERATRKSLA